MSDIHLEMEKDVQTIIITIIAVFIIVAALVIGYGVKSMNWGPEVARVTKECPKGGIVSVASNFFGSDTVTCTYVKQTL